MKNEKAISSAANPSIKKIRSLALKKYRDAEKLFVAEGLRHVTEALEAGWSIESLVYTARARSLPLVEKAIAACVEARGQCLEVTEDLLSRITQRDNAQAVVGVFHQRYGALSDVAGEGLWVALEKVRDPGNLGTIVRTADCTGVRGVLLVGGTCDPWSPEAIRASMGSFARIPLIPVGLDEFLAWKKTFAGQMVGTHLRTKTDFRAHAYTLPLILAMGNEQAGLSDELAAACDLLVKIPMTGKADSLNLAVSTGIMLYEICKNRL